MSCGGEEILERKNPILWNNMSAEISDFLQSCRGSTQQEFAIRLSALGVHTHRLSTREEEGNFMKDHVQSRQRLMASSFLLKKVINEK
jgi:hypothetical protein